jgi:hypothetical protein
MLFAKPSCHFIDAILQVCAGTIEARRLQHAERKGTHLLLQLRQLLGKSCYFRCQRYCRLLPVGRVKLAQIC